MEVQKFFLRNATENDRELIFNWSNDELVRKNSFSEKKIEWDEHCAWYNVVLDDSNLLFYILSDGENDKGQIRVKFEDDNNAIISYSIGKEYRGLGLGRLILYLAENKIAEDKSNIRLHAYVKKDNVASNVLFQELGYSVADNESMNVHYTKTATLNNSTPHTHHTHEHKKYNIFNK